MERMPNLEEISVEEVVSEEFHSLWDLCRREPEPELFFKRNRRFEKSSTLKNKIRDKRKYLLYSDVNRNKYVETFRGVYTETSKESSYETMIVSYFKKEFNGNGCKVINKNYFAEKFENHIHLYDLETKKFFKSFTCNYLNHTLYDNRSCTYGEYVKKVRDLETITIPERKSKEVISRWKKIGHNKFFFGKPAVTSRDFWDSKVFIKGVSIPVIDKKHKCLENDYSRSSYKKDLLTESISFFEDSFKEREAAFNDVESSDYEDPSYYDFLEYLEEQERLLNPLEYDYDDYNYLEDLIDYDEEDFFFDDEMQ